MDALPVPTGLKKIPAPLLAIDLPSSWQVQSCVSHVEVVTAAINSRVQWPCYIWNTAFHSTTPHPTALILLTSCIMFPEPWNEWCRCPIYRQALGSRLFSPCWQVTRLHPYHYPQAFLIEADDSADVNIITLYPFSTITMVASLLGPMASKPQVPNRIYSTRCELSSED